MIELFNVNKMNLHLHNVCKQSFKALLLLMFFATCLNKTFAQSSNLEGKWLVDSVFVKKTEKGQVVTYTSTAKKQKLTFGAQPISIIITADSLTVNYRNNSTEKGVYQIDGSQLAVQMETAPLTYTYTKLAANQLKLEQTVKYWIDSVEPVSEQYSIFLHRQE